MNHVFDTTVIGGGAEGTAAAYFLSKYGQDVLLLEQGSLADGSSSRCDSNVHVGDSAAGIDTDFIRMSLRIYPEVANDMDMDIGWRVGTSMYVFETEPEIAVGAKLVKEKQEAGIPIRLVDQKEVHELEPNLAPDIIGGILIGGEGEVNPMKLCVGLARRAVQYGATVKTHCKVTGITKEKGGFLIHTTGEIFATEKIVICAGVWTPAIGEMVGLTVPIIPRQGQLLVTDVASGFVNRTVTEFGYIMTRQESQDFVRNTTPEMDEYGVAGLVEPTEAGTLLIGSSRRFCGFDIRNDDRVIKAMAQRAIRFFPKLAQLNMIRCYAGLRPYTSDHMPIISETPVKGVYISSGHEGSGIALSVASGTLIAELVCGKPTSLPVDAFAYSRFVNQ